MPNADPSLDFAASRRKSERERKPSAKMRNQDETQNDHDDPPSTLRPPRAAPRAPSVSKPVKKAVTPKMALKTPKREPRERNAGRKNERNTPSDDSDEEEHFDIHALTYTVPPRVRNYQRSCCFCARSDQSKETKKETVDNDGSNSNKDDEIVEKNEDYISCAHKNCTQKMHKKCADEFICAEYSPRQAALLFRTDGPICPAHFCWHCYEERQKNSARFGELIDCEQCIRSFHVECMPAGTKITSESKKRKTFVCHYHAPKKAIKNSTRLKVCLECDQPFKDGERVECTTCTNVYHRGCSFREVRGEGSEAYKGDRCTYCLTGGVIVPNQKVLAYCGIAFKGLGAGTYPGVAMAMKDIPATLAVMLGRDYGKIGYIPIKWIWKGLTTPYYNMVHKSLVQRVGYGCHNNLTFVDFLDEVKEAGLNIRAPTRPVDSFALRDTLKIVTDNVYMKGISRRTERHSTVLCSCTPDPITKIKCANNTCETRAINAECVKECDEAPGVFCANRCMQRPDAKTNLKYEVKSTDGKGFGVFATKEIKPLEYIFEYAGEVMDKAELDKRADRLKKLRSYDESTYLMGLCAGLWVDARFIGSNARYANHSCDPNCEVESMDIPVRTLNREETLFEPKLKVIALRRIVPGEEITFSYALAKSKSLALDICKCGAPNCEGRIGKKIFKDTKGEEEVDVVELEDLSDDDLNDAVESEKENEKKKKKMAALSKKIADAKKKASKKRRASSTVSPGPPTSRAGTSKKVKIEE